ncbi:MAG: cyclic nucleotide-binding domain-containing protein [Oscillochloris sp.]|nr:cyclic nucleotide-binding domain-containing protein [Oscillochloris sp.]
MCTAAGISYLIEVLQPLNMRSRDPLDAVANTLGVAIGAALGLLVRLIYGYLRTELSAAQVRRAIKRVPAGTTIVRVGDAIDRFFIIKRGEVLLYREHDGRREVLDRLGPGEMFGLLAEIERMPQPVTVVAATDVQVYEVDYDRLLQQWAGRRNRLR